MRQLEELLALFVTAVVLAAEFPYRDLIVLTAFSVVLGTLVIQGVTLKPLLRALDLHDDDPVGREVRTARQRALAAGLECLTLGESSVADGVRREFRAYLSHDPAGADGIDTRAVRGTLHRNASVVARRTIVAMRASHEIGDDAFH